MWQPYPQPHSLVFGGAVGRIRYNGGMEDGDIYNDWLPYALAAAIAVAIAVGLWLFGVWSGV
jgi:hypothetical protein